MTKLNKVPLISVCVITYNHEKFITQTLEGILSQKTEYPIQIVIGEDYSTDATRQICEKYAALHQTITLLPSEKNWGISGNFLRTLQACQGEYVAICEGDDYWTDNQKLQMQVEFLEHNIDFSLCFHSVGVDTNGRIAKNAFVVPPAEFTTLTDLAKSNYIFTPSVLYRRAHLNLDEVSQLYSTIYDYVIWMECAAKGKIKYIDREMANYRIHEANKWATFNKASRLFTWLEIIYSLEVRFPHLKISLDLNKSSTITVFLDALYESDELTKLNQLLLKHQDQDLLLVALKNRIVQLKSSTSYRLGKKIVDTINAIFPWLRKK